MTYRYEPDSAWSSGRPKLRWRPSWIFVILVAAFVGSAIWMYRNGTSEVVFNGGFGDFNLAVFLFIISGWVVTLCLHEFGHAFLAYRAGDNDVEARGYLTLDPRKYAHPFLSIVLPLLFVALGGIGLPGGAVWINHAHIRGSRFTHAMVSLIGPLINLAFGVGLGAAVLLFADADAIARHQDFWAAVGFLAILQFTAGVLNILPVPGLDGGNAIEPYLNHQWKRGFAYVRPWGMLLVIGLLISSPLLNKWFFDLIFGLSGLFDVNSDYYRVGRALFWPLSPLI